MIAVDNAITGLPICLGLKVVFQHRYSKKNHVQSIRIAMGMRSTLQLVTQ